MFLGKLVVTATEQETVVKFKGYIMVVGAGEQVECAVESDGKFRLVFSASSSGEPFKLFKEAPCRYSIRQLDSACSFFKIDPKVCTFGYSELLFRILRPESCAKIDI